MREQKNHSGAGARARAVPPRQDGMGQAPILPPPGRVPESFAGRVVVAVLIALVLLGLAWLVRCGFTILLEAFAGFLLAVFLSTLAGWVNQKTHLSYGWSLFGVILILVLIFSGLGWLLSSHISGQISEMSVKLPEALHQIHAYLEKSTWGKLLLEQVPPGPGSVSQVGVFSQVTGLISGVVAVVVTALVILGVGIFGAAEQDVYYQGFLHLIPPLRRPRFCEFLQALIVNLRWWLLGQVVLMIGIGILTTLGLWLLGVPLAMSLGLIAGLVEIVPYLGPWMSAIPALLIALLVSPWTALGVAVLYVAVHILEGYVMLPLVQRRTVLLPPALTLVTQILLGELLGLMGLMVAAPLTVCVVVVVKMFYIEDLLGDENITVPGEPDSVAQGEQPVTTATAAPGAPVGPGCWPGGAGEH